MKKTSDKNKIKIVILAAGKGTRMKSELPKALVKLRGKHMIKHLLESIDEISLDSKPIVVVGYKKELVMNELGNKYHYVVQEEQLGTGHALMVAENACENAENIIVISGDQPFLKSETIKKLLEKHKNSGTTITITTTVLPDYKGWKKAFLTYGRIIRKDGKIIDKEIKDCTKEELKIKEVNVSCYAFKTNWLWNKLKKLDKNSNSQREYQLTDLWQMAGDEGKKIESIQVDASETLGVNSKEELSLLENFKI